MSRWYAVPLDAIAYDDHAHYVFAVGRPWLLTRRPWPGERHIVPIRGAKTLDEARRKAADAIRNAYPYGVPAR